MYFINVDVKMEKLGNFKRKFIFLDRCKFFVQVLKLKYLKRMEHMSLSHKQDHR